MSLKFKRVVVYDSNFCYDSKKAGYPVENSTFDKTSVLVSDVYERDTETTATLGVDTIRKYPGAAVEFKAGNILGCQGNTKAQ